MAQTGGEKLTVKKKSKWDNTRMISLFNNVKYLVNIRPSFLIIPHFKENLPFSKSMKEWS